MSELKWEDLLGLEKAIEESNRKCDVCQRTVPEGEVTELWAVGEPHTFVRICATCPKPETA